MAQRPLTCFLVLGGARILRGRHRSRAFGREAMVSGRYSRGWRGALEAFVLRLTNIRVCMELLGAFDARGGVGWVCCIQDLKKWCNLRDITLIAARSGSWRRSCSGWSCSWRHRSSSASSSARRSLCIARSERARSETCAQAAWDPSDGFARSCQRL